MAHQAGPALVVPGKWAACASEDESVSVALRHPDPG